MPRRSPRHALLPTVALVLAAAAACDDAAPPVAPSAASPDAPRFARASTRPTGKGIGTIDTKGDRTHQKLEYHGGPVLTATPNVYVIWYGFWQDHPAVPILTDFLTSVGGSSYFSINTLYQDANGGAPSGGLAYGGSIDDWYSLGSSLTDSDVGIVASQAAAGGQLPVDPNGIYVVFTSSDVDVTSGLAASYCGYHGVTNANGVALPYILVGAATRAGTRCGAQSPSPNGNPDADAMASVLANELSNTLTDPFFTAWYDRFGLEPGDKCAWSYGSTYTTTNGARANVHLGGRDYLLQQLWIPGGRAGVCSLDASAAAIAAANAS